MLSYAWLKLFALPCKKFCSILQREVGLYTLVGSQKTRLRLRRALLFWHSHSVRESLSPRKYAVYVRQTWTKYYYAMRQVILNNAQNSECYEKITFLLGVCRKPFFHIIKEFPFWNQIVISSQRKVFYDCFVSFSYFLKFYNLQKYSQDFSKNIFHEMMLLQAKTLIKWWIPW